MAQRCLIGVLGQIGSVVEELNPQVVPEWLSLLLLLGLTVPWTVKLVLTATTPSTTTVL